MSEWNISQALGMDLAYYISSAAHCLNTLRAQPTLEVNDELFNYLDRLLDYAAPYVKKTQTDALQARCDDERRILSTAIMKLKHKQGRKDGLQQTISYVHYQDVRDLFKDIMRELGMHNLLFKSHVNQGHKNDYDRIKHAMKGRK